MDDENGPVFGNCFLHVYVFIFLEDIFAWIVDIKTDVVEKAASLNFVRISVDEALGRVKTPVSFFSGSGLLTPRPERVDLPKGLSGWGGNTYYLGI